MSLKPVIVGPETRRNEALTMNTKKELIQSLYFLGVTTQEPVSTRVLNCTQKCFSVVGDTMQVHIQHLALMVKSDRTYFLHLFFRCRTTLVIR